MSDENLIREITAIVLQKLLQPEGKVLFVLTGADGGNAFLQDIFRQLHEKKIRFDLLLTNAAYEMTDLDQLNGAWQPDHFWIGRAAEAERVLIRNYECIVLPAPEIPTVARIASCMPQDYAESVVLEALLFDRKVMIGRDACCPDCLRKDAGASPAEALSERLKDNLKSLAQYGARIEQKSGLFERILQFLHPVSALRRKKRPEESPGKSLREEKTSADGRNREYFQGRILSAKEVRSRASGTILVLSRGTIVTQMAEEIARRNAIDIRMEE